jgi:SNF family Na+-dependent transporter
MDCGLDTLIAVLAGLAIFRAVFALGFAPDSGLDSFYYLPAFLPICLEYSVWIWIFPSSFNRCNYLCIVTS